MQLSIMNSHEVFIHIHQGCFAGTGAIVRLPQCQWSKPDGYGKISQCITTTKHSKAKTVCIFLGINCKEVDYRDTRGQLKYEIPNAWNTWSFTKYHIQIQDMWWLWHRILDITFGNDGILYWISYFTLDIIYRYKRCGNGGVIHLSTIANLKVG